MIGRIQGILLEKQPPRVLVDVQGVGYDVDVSMNTLFRLPAVLEAVVLHTHFVVREDAQQLYGFFETQERALFRALIKVNGVGPKMALALLSGMTVTEFVGCVNRNDTQALVKLPGVGKKTAERLLIEMRDKVELFSGSQDHQDALDSVAVDAPAFDAVKMATADAESALIALGYKPQEASRVIGKVVKAHEGDLDSEALIRLALKNMVN